MKFAMIMEMQEFLEGFSEWALSYVFAWAYMAFRMEHKILPYGLKNNLLG